MVAPGSDPRRSCCFSSARDKIIATGLMGSYWHLSVGTKRTQPDVSALRGKADIAK